MSAHETATCSRTRLSVCGPSRWTCAGSRCDEGTAGSRWIAVAELGALAGEFVFKWVAADDDEPVEGRLAGVEGNIAEGR
mmetsp:Transcript_47030/g.116450  ORF Transcript_47030/g.116450 Transcript_47030/m.116450 type:complete len:80 (+) Transcript_47030:848-1087(+)